MITNILFFTVACLFLVLSGRGLVKSLIKISQFLNITEFVAAFIIMAVATSLPELSVGISSALAHNNALSLGNVIGANLLDITLISGVFILLNKGIKMKSKKIKKDVFYLIGIAALPLILFLIGNSISRIDGVILLSVFFLYSWSLIKKSRGFEKKYKDKRRVNKIEIIMMTGLFIASLAALFISAHFVIKYATQIALDFNLPYIIIGLFLISIGTTLPEMTFGIRAVLSGHEEMSISDQMGTVIVNSTLVLGISALIYPITAQASLFFVSATFLLFSLFLFAAFIRSGIKLDTTEGVSLILLYILFIIIEIYVSGKFII